MVKLQRSILALVMCAVAFSVKATPPPTLRPLLVTVDDLPVASRKLHTDFTDRERVTRQMLQVLDRHHIRAVGFVAWEKVSAPADLALLEQWVKAGHELGNHTFAHLDFFTSTSDAYVADAEKGRVALAKFLETHGKKPRFFHFPGLSEGETEEKWSAMQNYLTSSSQKNLPVTIDIQDWTFEAPWVAAAKADNKADMQKVGEDYQRALQLAVLHQERDGDEIFKRALPQIIRLHATEVGGAQWDAFFEWLEKSGHRFVSADEVLTDPVFTEKYHFIAPFGCSLWERIATDRFLQKVRNDVEALLQEQAQSWSRGDIKKFCSAYSDDATFLGPTGLTHGRQAIEDRYRQRYPTGAAMGNLKLEVLEFSPAWGMEVSMLDDAVPSRAHGATVVARWTLTYPDKEPTKGLTLLALHRVRQKWLIVQDASM